MHIVARKPSERAPERMAPLAVLPAFFDLDGRRAVVAGGSDAAAWKAELLAACGAEVHIYAAAPGAVMDERLRAGTVRGALVRHARAWTDEDLRGAAIAVCDAGDEAEAAAFVKAAEGAGAPVNVIDRPAHCRFQFGSIVNRSPVVVGISTAGAAPILGQAIRRRIETLLPPSLACWARRAAALREKVAAQLAPGAPRRRFWEGFVDRAFSAPPESSGAATLESEIAEIARDGAVRRGLVTLVGAGPGDAELLTLKAVRALQAADVILFDDLVSDAVLELARREAKRIQVGKRGGRASCRQDDINALMVELARAGKRVVRLKAGDPAIFARAGEEIAMLEEQGIDVRTVPGITAASAMAAALGVSLTHRDHARSVRFVTGHSRHGDLPDDLDWDRLADPAATTVFYMAGRTAGRIAARLIEKGTPAATPVAVAANLSRPDQHLAHTTLAGLARRTGEGWPDGPVLIGVGAVFAARRPTAAGRTAHDGQVRSAGSRPTGMF